MSYSKIYKYLQILTLVTLKHRKEELSFHHCKALIHRILKCPNKLQGVLSQKFKHFPKGRYDKNPKAPNLLRKVKVNPTNNGHDSINLEPLDLGVNEKHKNHAVKKNQSPKIR